MSKQITLYGITWDLLDPTSLIGAAPSLAGTLYNLREAGVVLSPIEGLNVEGPPPGYVAFGSGWIEIGGVSYRMLLEDPHKARRQEILAMPVMKRFTFDVQLDCSGSFTVQAKQEEAAYASLQGVIDAALAPLGISVEWASSEVDLTDVQVVDET